MKKNIQYQTILLAILLGMILYTPNYPKKEFFPDFPDAALESCSPFYINGDTELSAYCAGNISDGLSWSTAYFIRDRIINASSSDYGIMIANTNYYLIIENCIVFECGWLTSYSAAIRLEGTNFVKIRNCTLYNNLYHGIHGRSIDNCIIENCLIYNNNIGVRLDEVCSSNTMSNNQIHHNTAEGIHLYYSAGSILMTTIRENNVSFNFHGIYFNTGAQNSVIDRNIITNNTEYGIYANSGFHTISNNALWGNLVFEIIVVGTATTVIEKNALGIDADTDGDGLSDYLELCQIKTDRFLVDTDGDNYLDGYEVKNGTDPIDPLDFPEKLDITNITNNYITNNNTIYNCTCNATNANQTDNSDFVPLNDQIVGFPIQWIGLGSVGCIIVSSFKKKRVINRNIP